MSDTVPTTKRMTAAEFQVAEGLPAFCELFERPFENPEIHPTFRANVSDLFA